MWINQPGLLLDFLGRNSRKKMFKFPFICSFPKNAHESTSLILTYLLEEKLATDPDAGLARRPTRARAW